MKPESNGGIAMTPEELERARDIDWAWREPELQEKYPDQFVAVYRRQVVAHGHNQLKVLEQAEQVTGLPRDKIALTTILGPKTLFMGH